MPAVIRKQDHWSEHTPAPEVLLDSAGLGWGAVFNEVHYGPGGSWDMHNEHLHIAALLNPAVHRHGSTRNPYISIAPSAALALPGQRVFGGWTGEMAGRHLFITADQYEALMDEPFRPEAFQTESFALQSAPTRAPSVTEGILSALAADLRHGNPTGSAFAQMAICALLTQLRITQRDPYLRPTNRSVGDRRINEVIDHINDSLAQRLSLVDLATTAGISVQYLCRTFRNVTGVSPHQYIVQQRVRRARDLLLHSTLSMSEIAAEVGFSDQSQMATSFRRVLGVRPSQVERRHRRL